MEEIKAIVLLILVLSGLNAALTTTLIIIRLVQIKVLAEVQKHGKKAFNY